MQLAITGGDVPALRTRVPPAAETRQVVGNPSGAIVRPGDYIVPFGVETGQPVRFDGMFHPVGPNLTMAEAKRSRINAFGIQYEGKTGLSTSEFSWAA